MVGTSCRRLFDDARDGCGGIPFQRAEAHLKKAHVAQERDTAISMALGVAMAAQALDQNRRLPFRYLLARNGFALMDDAVTRAPDSMPLRLQRGMAELYAHKVLQREKILDADAAWLERYLDAPDPRISNLDLAGIHLFLGRYLEKMGGPIAEIQAHFRAARDLAPTTDWGEEARRRLAGTWIELDA